MPPQNTMGTEPKSNGALIGAIIIVIILIIGGVYLWQTKSAPETLSTEDETTQTANTAELETELNTMDLDSLDQEI